jgi:hypothetical protein
MRAGWVWTSDDGIVPRVPTLPLLGAGSYLLWAIRVGLGVLLVVVR